jgi:hypothetical protein
MVTHTMRWNVLTFELGPILLWICFAHGDMIPWHLNLRSWIWNQINILICTSKHYRYIYIFYTTTCPYGYFCSSNYYIAKKFKFPKKLFTRWKNLSQKKKKTLLVHVTWVGIKTFRPENQNQCCNKLKKGKQWFCSFNFVMLLKWQSSIKIFGQISKNLQYWKYESKKILSTLSCHRLWWGL